MIRGPTISNIKYPVLFLQTLLEALIVTGRSASCFGEKYRHLLLYLRQKLDVLQTVINKHILLYNSIYGTRFYVVMWHQILYFLQNLVIPLLLFANKERSSSERRMEGGIADETSMPPFKCESLGSTD